MAEYRSLGTLQGFLPDARATLCYNMTYLAEIGAIAAKKIGQKPLSKAP